MWTYLFFKKVNTLVKHAKMSLMQPIQLPRYNRALTLPVLSRCGTPAHLPCFSPLWGCKAWSLALPCESCSSPGSHWHSPHSSPVETKGDSVKTPREEDGCLRQTPLLSCAPLDPKRDMWMKEFHPQNDLFSGLQVIRNGTKPLQYLFFEYHQYQEC